MRTRIPKRNPKRAAREFVRCYESQARVRWVCARPSVISGLTPCVNAHTEGGGMGRKGDARTIVPLTDREHRQLHQWGRKSFEAFYGLVPDFLADHATWTEAAWRRECGE